MSFCGLGLIDVTGAGVAITTSNPARSVRCLIPHTVPFSLFLATRKHENGIQAVKIAKTTDQRKVDKETPKGGLW